MSVFTKSDLPESANGCCVIGEGDVVSRCLEILLMKGYVVLGVISSDLRLKQFCENNKIKFYLQLDKNVPDDHHVLFLKEEPYDYLLSVVNNYFIEDVDVGEFQKFCFSDCDTAMLDYAWCA